MIQDYFTIQRFKWLQDEQEPLLGLITGGILCLLLVASIWFAAWYFHEDYRDWTDEGVGCIDDCLELQPTKGGG